MKKQLTKQTLSILSIFILVFAFSIQANAAEPKVATAPGKNKIICFSGSTDSPGVYNGTCTLASNGAKGPVVLDNNDGDSDPYNNYSGVYVEESNVYNTMLADLNQLSFQYTGDAATAGSPRVSIPVDTDGDGVTNGYLFVSAYYCNDGTGLVDVINDPTCTIYTNFSGESFDNWMDLVATYPNWSISDDQYIFIVADDAGTWTLNNVKFGKAGKK